MVFSLTTFLKEVVPMMVVLWLVFVPIALAALCCALPLRLVCFCWNLLFFRKGEKKAKLAVHVTDAAGTCKGTVVLVHGWPDSHEMWKHNIPALTKAGYRCLTVDLPGFCEGNKLSGVDYHVKDLAVMLHTTVKDYLSKGEKVTLLLHDWGCVVGSEFFRDHPQLVSRAIVLDVIGLEPTTHGLIYAFAYQAYLALAYLINGFIGKCMTLSLLSLAEYDHRPWSAINPDMNYLYYTMWKGLITGTLKLRRFTTYKSVPVLYGWGTKKAIKFHDPAVVEEIKNAKNGSEVKEYKSRHWIMLDCPGQLNDDMVAFLKKPCS
ncbi:AB hydrolase superfamily protein YfhM [Diplonema papillatum]|nr:AB hydrolase superfamily protein YfhM [Diplonema papillatum]